MSYQEGHDMVQADISYFNVLILCACVVLFIYAFFLAFHEKNWKFLLLAIPAVAIGWEVDANVINYVFKNA